MSEVVNQTSNESKSLTYDAIKIGLASLEKIREW